VLISLVSVLNLLYFYISTFRSVCAVPNMAVFCRSLTSCFPDIVIVIIIIIIIIIIEYTAGQNERSIFVTPCGHFRIFLQHQTNIVRSELSLDTQISQLIRLFTYKK